MKKSPKIIIERIDKAIIELKNSEAPESLGDLKNGALKGFRAYEVGRKNRILYTVERKEGNVEIIFWKVCNHTQAYGVD